ncbi:MAG: addiction module antidote protein, HigA family [Lentisphaerae bacterium GWF2_44_16]|nr:MAG: addiction module antidote protein, HigA family [Lentisphaerae bacterium GWF2_44_16]
MKSEKTLSPVHPGEILQCDFLEPMNLSQNKLSLEIKVSARRINEIVLGKRGITADTALRLSIFFGTTPELWLNLQNQYEIDTAKLKEEEELRQIIRPFKAA